MVRIIYYWVLYSQIIVCENMIFSLLQIFAFTFFCDFNTVFKFRFFAGNCRNSHYEQKISFGRQPNQNEHLCWRPYWKNGGCLILFYTGGFMEYFHNYRLSIRISSVKSGRKGAVHSMSVNAILICFPLA